MLLFAGLWVLADREGRLEYRPRWIKAQVFPYDKTKIEVYLERLEQSGFTQTYESGGKTYIQIVNWDKHQKPHHTEKESALPEPMEIQRFREIPVNSPLDNRSLTSEQLDAHSPLPINNTPLTIPHKRGSGGELNGFDLFWSAYPKKRNKGRAEKVWEKLKPSSGLQMKILESIEEHTQCFDWTKENGQFIPYPEAWLNAKGWEDELHSEESQLEGVRRLMREREENE